MRIYIASMWYCLLYTSQSNPDVGCSMELFGKDSRAKKIISYAASFGNTGIKELKRFDVQDEIAELL